MQQRLRPSVTLDLQQGWPSIRHSPTIIRRLTSMSNSSNISYNSNDEWVKIGEAAKLLGISYNSLRKLVKEGYLKAYRVRGIVGVQFRRGDVLALLEEVPADEIDREADEDVR